MKKIALIGAAGVIGLSGLAAGQIVTPNPPGTDSSATGAQEQATPQRSRSGGHRHRPSAVESLDAGAVTGTGAPTSRRNKFVRDGAVSGVTTGLGYDATAGAAGATSSSGATAGSSRSGVTSGSGGSSSGATSGITSASGASGATSGSSASFVGSVTHSVTGVTSAGGNQGGNAGGNAGSKSNGKGKGK
jgi:hypothetical protein